MTQVKSISDIVFKGDATHTFTGWMGMTAEPVTLRFWLEHFQFRWFKSGSFLKTSRSTAERLHLNQAIIRNSHGLTFLIHKEMASYLPINHRLGVIPIEIKAYQADHHVQIRTHKNGSKINLDCPEGYLFVEIPSLPGLDEWVVSTEIFRANYNTVPVH